MKRLIGSEARKPNPTLKPFEPLIGEWRTTGTHPLVPGKTFHGRASFSWTEDGAFLMWRSEIDEPEIPSGMAIFGSDDAEGTFLMLYFDERGVSRKYGVTISGRVMTWSRDDPKFRQRMTLTIDADGSRIVSKGVITGKQVVAQTRARILRGETKSEGKLVSIFEPHTQIIRKGKKHKPTEFGRTVKVQEAEGGVVTDIAVVNVSDSALVESSIDAHKKHFGRAPRVLSADRGFYSSANVARAAEMGVRQVVIPKPGHRSDEVHKKEQARPFRRARAWRAGGEARISRLKRTFGMARSRYRGEAGLARCTYWAAIANNLVAIARAP